MASSFTSLFAQSVEFNMPDLTIGCGEMVAVPVTVESDVTLASIQFTIRWDDNILQHVTNSDQVSGSTQFGPNGNDGPFDGILTYSWSNPSGTAFQPGDILFVMNFNLVGSAIPPTALAFSNSPTSIEAGGPGFTEVPSSTNDGSVTTGSDNANPTFPNGCADASGTAAAGECGVIVNFNDPLTDDDCDSDVAVTYAPFGSGDYYPVGTTSVTATATDDSGKTATCTFNVVVTGDGTNDADPVITNCPINDITATTPQGASSTTVNNLAINATDCEMLTFSYVLTGATSRTGSTNDASGVFNIGTTTVTYSVTDESNNTVTCIFDVVVTAGGIAGDLELFAVASSSDCSDQTMTVDIMANNFQDIASLQYSVSWDETVVEFASVSNLALGGAFFGEDPDNLGSPLTFSWSDPNGLTFPNNPTLLYTITFNIVGQGGDNTPFTFVNSPTSVEAGNTNFEEVTVITTGTTIRIDADNIPPTITQCPSGVVNAMTNPGETSVVVNGIEGDATDNCGFMESYTLTGATVDSGTGDANGQPFNIGTTDVTYTYDDGNTAVTCSFQVVVQDSDNLPLILTATGATPIGCTQQTASVDINVDNFDNLTSLQFTVTFDESVLEFSSVTNIGFTDGFVFGPIQNDLGSPLTFSWSDSDGFSFPGGSGTAFTINFDVRGALGSSTAIVFGNNPSPIEAGGPGPLFLEVEVETNNTTVSIAGDNQDPMITCPDTGSVQCGDSLDPANTGMATATDNCNANPTIDFTDNTSGLNDCGIGTINRTWMADDGNGQTSTCQQIILVSARPINATCQDVSVTLDENGMASIVAAQVNDNSTGGCGMLSLAVNQTDFDCNDIGNNPVVTLTVTDECDNPATCEATVTVLGGNGGGQLSITCPSDMTITCNDSSDPANTGTATATDDCGGGNPTVTFSDDDSGLAACGTGTKIRTWTAATSGSATETCTQTININSVAITATCQDIMVQVDDNGSTTITAAQINNNSAGGCGTLDFVIDINSFDCGSIGANTVTLTATDDCGETMTCTSTVTVEMTDEINITCPSDRVVNCNSLDDMAVTGTAIAVDACNNTLTNITFSDNPANGGNCVSTITRTWTATSGANMATCVQTITVMSEPIIALCQDVTVNLDENGTATITEAQVNNMSSGGCGDLNFTLSESTFDCNAVGENTVTLTVLDDCNNSETCTSTITVNSNSGGGGTFMINCDNVPDISLVCNDSTDPANTGMATATDDCSGTASVVSFEDDTSQLNACGVGTITRTWTATNGTETQTCDQIITVNNQPINENCFDISVVLDQNDMATITPDNINNSTGGCGTLTFDLDVNTFTCDDAGNNNIVTLTITDECSVSETCTSTVTVLPADNVMITCPGEAIVNCGESISPDVTGMATALDACNNVVVNVAFTDNPANGGNCVGTITRTWIATDAAGNTATCPQTITVRAETLEVMCQDISVQLNGSGTASVTPEQIHVSSMGGCGTLELSAAPTDFTSDDVGPNDVVLTVTDDCGSTAMCTAVVTVIEEGEETPPIITCPTIGGTSADTLSCNAVVNGVIVTVNSPQDEVESVSYTLTGATTGNGTGNDASGSYNVGATTVTYTVTGTNGLTSTCSVVVTVNDTQTPTTDTDTCPENISLDIQAGSCDTTVTWVEPMFSDNCTINTVMQSHESGDIFSAGTTTVTYTATDDAGNMGTCSFDVTISEPVDPTITCGDNIIVSNDLDSCSAIVSWDIPEGMDNCDGAVVTSSNNPGDSFPIGTTTVTHTVTDASGNTAMCTFDITVNDDQAPAFNNCPSDIILTVVNEGACDTIVDWPIPVVSDNCPGSVILTTTHQPNGAFPIGTTMVEYIATDANNNADTCRFNVIVMGNSIANDFCTADITQPNAVGECQSVVIWDEPTFSSDCSSLNVESTHNPGDVFPVGTTMVEYVALDTFGNTDTCRFDVTVLDTEMPVINNCPMDTVINVEAGNCSVDYIWDVPTFEDNCGVQDTAFSHNPGDTFELGETEVVYSVVDMNGNVAFCRFMVSVQDNNGPIIDCPEAVEIRIDGTIVSDPSMIITNAVSDNCNAISIEFDAPTAMDECSTSTIEQTDTTGLMSGSTFPVGETILEYTATDTFNNVTICEVSITVASFASVDPIVTNSEPCETEFVKFSAPELDNATYTWVGPDGTMYNGSELSIEMVGLEDSGEWTITIVDENGCSSFGTFTITVYPTPSVVASASSTIFCGVGDENLQLMAEDNANADVIEWCWQTPNRGQICEQNPLISSVGADDSGLYIVTGITEQGCLSSDTVEVSVLGVNGPILPTLIATPNNICLEDAVALTGTSYAGASVEYNWSAEPLEGSGLTDINANVLLVTPTIAGDYTYSYWVTDGGCSTDTATVVVHVEQPAPITIEVEGETECVDGTTPIILTAITSPDSANTSAVNCTWILPDGSTANPGDVLILNNVTSAQTGNYMVVCNTNNTCESTNTIFLDITDQTETPDLSVEDNEICDGESFNINVLTEYDPTANYSWTAEPMEGSGLPGIATTTSLEVTPTTAGTYVYSLVVTIDGCVSQAGTVSATLGDTPMPDLSQMPTNLDCIEAGTSLTLIESSGTAMSWSWETPRGPMTGNNIVMENITTADAGTYTVMATNAEGCSAMESTEITITGALATPAIKGPDALCEGEDITGDLFCVTNPVDGATYTWTGPSGELSATGACLIINNITGFNAGEYTVVSNLDGCSSASSAAFVLDVLDAPMLEDDELPAFIGLTTVVDATINDDFNKDVPFTVNIISTVRKGEVINEGNGTFTYTPNAGEFGADNMIYEICYDDCPDNCDMATISFDIKFADDECRPTTVISPNGDGKNDEFIITCIDSDLFPNNTLVVYNQWGDQVYQAAPYANDWGGTYKGENLPDGTYFFIFMREPNDPDPIKSFITIYK